MTNHGQLEKQVAELRQRVAELESRTSDGTLSGTLRAIVEGTAATSGDQFFETLVQYLAKSLDAQYAFVGQFAESRSRIRTRSVWTGEGWGENFEYDLAGTPCAAVVEGHIRHYADNVQSEFPENPLLKALNVRSYLAVPLTSTSGDVLGHLAMMDTEPRASSETDLSIFHIFAARATAELLRQAVEHERDQSVVMQRKAEAEVRYLRDELEATPAMWRIVGESAALRNMFQQVALVAPTESTVLIVGESGTGKELFAREIHRRSRRRDSPLVTVNCAALPASLIESELFGHERGAFTGASQQRIGRFELADGATIFLDEIAELPASGQARLLRVLQDGEFERVGGTETLQVSVRVVAATNRDLEAMVRAKEFRDDLYYRLNVFPLSLPPLRERREDVPLLAQHFADGFRHSIGRPQQSIPDSVLEELCRYDWPGNVRELQNVVERAVILSPGDTFVLPPGALGQIAVAEEAPGFATLAENEKRHIADALARSNGVIGGPSGAAALLDVHVSTLRSRMEKLGMLPPKDGAKNRRRPG